MSSHENPSNGTVARLILIEVIFYFDDRSLLFLTVLSLIIIEASSISETITYLAVEHCVPTCCLVFFGTITKLRK